MHKCKLPYLLGVALRLLLFRSEAYPRFLASHGPHAWTSLEQYFSATPCSVLVVFLGSFFVFVSRSCNICHAKREVLIYLFFYITLEKGRPTLGTRQHISASFLFSLHLPCLSGLSVKFSSGPTCLRPLSHTNRQQLHSSLLQPSLLLLYIIQDSNTYKWTGRQPDGLTDQS